MPNQKAGWTKEDRGPNSRQVTIFDKSANGQYQVKWSQGPAQGGSLGHFSNFDDARERAVRYMRKH